MQKAPYKFPARSRKAMLAYLEDRRGYVDHCTSYPFAWNVKARNVNYAHPKGEHTLSAEYDSEWAKRVEHGLPVEQAFEDASWPLANEWTSYPGDDQGDWHFLSAGRSGGWLVLDTWRGINVRSLDLPDLSTHDLRAFYRGIVCADSDFTPAKASQEVEYRLNDIRHEWEVEQDAARNERSATLAESIADSRPDLAPQY